MTVISARWIAARGVISWWRQGLGDGLARFNKASIKEAERLLYGTFAHHRWAASVAAGRPYGDLTELLASAEGAWSELAPADWLEAFAAHPRIGEHGGHSPEASEREQSQARQASSATLAALEAENRGYEARFGYVFLISARGRTGEEILAELRRRMSNNPATELQVAADEHRKITELRLEDIMKR